MSDSVFSVSYYILVLNTVIYCVMSDYQLKDIFVSCNLVRPLSIPLLPQVDIKERDHTIAQPYQGFW